MSEKTLGEKRIRTDFNVSRSDLVFEIKNDFAKLIDKLENHGSSNIAPEDFDFGEYKRLIATAQTKIEEAAMWTVKAITF